MNSDLSRSLTWIHGGKLGKNTRPRGSWPGRYAGRYIPRGHVGMLLVSFLQVVPESSRPTGNHPAWFIRPHIISSRGENNPIKHNLVTLRTRKRQWFLPGSPTIWQVTILETPSEQFPGYFTARFVYTLITAR